MKKTEFEQFSENDWRNAQALLRLLQYALQFTPEEFAQLEKWRDSGAKDRAKEKARKAVNARWAKYHAKRDAEEAE